MHFLKNFFIFKDFIYLFLDRGEGWKKERERNIVWLPLMCLLPGTWPTTLACALTGNQTSDPLVCEPVLSLLSHTSQGYCVHFHSSHYMWPDSLPIFSIAFSFLFKKYIHDILTFNRNCTQ